MNWSAALYRQDEDYERLNESIKAKGDSYDYTSYSVTSRRIDQGICLMLTLPLAAIGLPSVVMSKMISGRERYLHDSSIS
jgi:hypothetical protein